MDEKVKVDIQDTIATVTLSRPEAHNALTTGMIATLNEIFLSLDAADDVRVVVLTGEARTFCAGADISMMKSAGSNDYSANVENGRAIYELMAAINDCKKPVVGRINGSAFGGGVGLVSCCDIVISVQRAKFAFSEVRLGLVPAVISPFVLAKIGTSHARRLFVSGESFDADGALAIGLVHQIVTDEDLDWAVELTLQKLWQGAPGAQAAAKEMIARVAGDGSKELRDFLSTLIAERRATAEGIEGTSAFLEKRDPYWRNRR